MEKGGLRARLCVNDTREISLYDKSYARDLYVQLARKPASFLRTGFHLKFNGIPIYRRDKVYASLMMEK